MQPTPRQPISLTRKSPQFAQLRLVTAALFCAAEMTLRAKLFTGDSWQRAVHPAMGLLLLSLVYLVYLGGVMLIRLSGNRFLLSGWQLGTNLLLFYYMHDISLDGQIDLTDSWVAFYLIEFWMWVLLLPLVILVAIAACLPVREMKQD
jgi:hypothetical protein